MSFCLLTSSCHIIIYRTKCTSTYYSHNTTLSICMTHTTHTQLSLSLSLSHTHTKPVKRSTLCPTWRYHSQRYWRNRCLRYPGRPVAVCTGWPWRVCSPSCPRTRRPWTFRKEEVPESPPVPIDPCRRRVPRVEAVLTTMSR